MKFILFLLISVTAMAANTGPAPEPQAPPAPRWRTFQDEEGKPAFVVDLSNGSIDHLQSAKKTSEILWGMLGGTEAECHKQLKQRDSRIAELQSPKKKASKKAEAPPKEEKK